MPQPNHSQIFLFKNNMGTFNLQKLQGLSKFLDFNFLTGFSGVPAKKNLNNILFNVCNEDKQKKQNNSTNIEKYTFLQ